MSIFSSTQTLRITPNIPDSLRPLEPLSQNFWWTWHPAVRALFVKLDEVVWRKVGRNPVRLLREIDQSRLDAAAKDAAYVSALNEQLAKMKADLARPKSFPGDPIGGTVAYFSAEFGVHESLPIYSGGLGVLAGDHLKAASDLALPLIAVGLLYRNGYFEQHLSADGRQQEEFPEHDFADLAVELATGPDGKPVQVEVDWGARVVCQVWKANIGRVPLYLLDTDIPANSPDDRRLTARLYGVGSDTRIRQEIVLGIGGVRAIKALGITPDIFHMNEGHSAFLALERIRTHIEATGQTFDEARQHVMATNIFTTHTPVPAGIDRFTPDLIFRHFNHYWPSLQLDEDGFLALGREDVGDRKQGFSMAVLAIRLADTCNGVSALHGDVSRHMWNPVWPGVPADDVPITSVTNGIHTRTWVSPEIESLLGEANSPDFSRVAALPDSELWSIRTAARERMITYVRLLARRQTAMKAHVPVTVLDRLLDPNVLTIGFARRFATYKRGTLILRDPQRLQKLINHADRPIQFVFAGKAHPADEEGKNLIQAISQFTHGEVVRERMVFLDNYDMEIARHLVQGVDVWLNTPRRPHEASGTSGMKAAANGIPNLSILDGWWVEAYADAPDAGWAIGDGDSLPDPDAQDRLEADALYDLLEHEVAPAFYNRGPDGIPVAWMSKMRTNFTKVAPVFSTHRMVSEYAERLYSPAIRRGKTLAADGFTPAAALAHEKDRIRAAWDGVSVLSVRVGDNGQADVGSVVTIEATVQLGSLSVGDVRVEVLFDPPDKVGRVIPLVTPDPKAAGPLAFSAKIDCVESGKRRVGIRVVPAAANLATPFEPGLIRWG